eukprot:ANDGO_02758.mRNA.1 hypothetical protein ENU1_147930
MASLECSRIASCVVLILCFASLANSAESSSSNNTDHKPLFGPFDWTDVLGTLLVFFGGGFAAAAGIGGGGIYTPVYIFVMSFPVHAAIPLSKATAFGGAIANFIFNFPRKFKDKRTIIDYDAAMLLEPPTLLGSILGVILNVISPSWFIVIVLVLALGYTSKKAVAKGLTLWKKETSAKTGSSAQQKRKAQEMEKSMGNGFEGTEMEVSSLVENEATSFDYAGEELNEAPSPALPVQSEQMPSSSSSSSTAVAAVAVAVAAEPIIAPYKRFPRTPFAVLGLVWMPLMIMAFMRKAVVPSCSPSYWLLTVLAIPVAVSATLFAIKNMATQMRKYGPTALHMHWTPKTFTASPILAFLGGILTSYIGVGGGIVLNPLLMELGEDPTVASATSAYTILWTASSTTLQFAILGALTPDYASWFIVVGFLSAFAGQFTLDHAIKRWGRVSIIVFLVASLTIISCIAMSIMGIMETVDRAKTGRSLGFSSFC